MFENFRVFETEFAGRPLKIETGKMAQLANGECLVRYGETTIHVAATAAAKPRDGIDFFPLSVDFEEKLYSVGKIPGSFLKREGRPTDKAILVCRMIDRPIRYAEEFIKAGADWLTIHLESDQPQNTLACLDKIRALGCKAAISLKPKTPAEAAIPYLAKCDMVLVMTVEPGFGAQKFMADMMPKVKKIRQMLDEVNPACIIEVDGGVDAVTYRTCRENGAEALVTGSAYFKAADRAAFVKTLRA